MDGSQIFIAVLLFIIGCMLFNTSFSTSDSIFERIGTNIIPVFILALGVTALLKMEIIVLIGLLLQIIGLVYLTVDWFLMPFRYRKKVSAMCVRKNVVRPVYTGRRGRYINICMIYEYQGVKYQEYSENKVCYPAKAYKNSQEYRIYVCPEKPDKFVTRKWGAFFGSFFLMIMVFLYSQCTWLLVLSMFNVHP